MQRLLQDTKCKLLGGIFSYCIQLFLGFVAISSLVLKRQIERPQRKWDIWMFDVGKQLVGGFFIHCANIIVSHLLKSGGDECAFYFLNFFIDCTLGVGIVYIVHDGICYLIKTYWNPNSVFAHIGKYGNPPEVKIWIKQISLYLFALFINKILVGVTLYFLKSQMIYFGNLLFESLQPYPNTELVVVMILCPWLLTTFQMWTFDYILKSKNNQSYNERLLILNDYDEVRSIISEYTITDDSFSSVTLTE